MKNVILLFVLVFSLNASDVMCEDAYKRYKKYAKLVEFAFERKDFRAMKVSVDMEILYAERALVNCGDDWALKDSVTKVRKIAIKISESLR